MKNMKRIIKNGIPAYVAPWFKDLTPEMKRAILSTKIMAPYGRKLRQSLTEIEYTYKTAAEFINETHGIYAIAAE